MRSSLCGGVCESGCTLVSFPENDLGTRLVWAAYIIDSCARPVITPSSVLSTIMADAVAAKVLGPRPGKAIVSFWQGRVEILLRFLAADVSMHLDANCTISS